MRRRRREQKTDYKLRLSLLQSGKDRIVIRRTNNYFIAQVVKSSSAQDSVVASVSSKDLLKIGWDKAFAGSLKSIPAGYLTGLLLAKKVGKGSFIVDLGMARTIHGSRVFSVVKGLIDGGLDISANEKAFPNEDRLLGKHLKEALQTVIETTKTKI